MEQAKKKNRVYYLVDQGHSAKKFHIEALR